MIHHLRNKSLLFIFLHPNSLNFDPVLGTGFESMSKISGLSSELGYNRVPNFETGSKTGVTGSRSVLARSKLLMGLELGIC